MAYVYAAYVCIHVTIFSTGDKVRLVSTFMKLHALMKATCSCALLNTCSMCEQGSNMGSRALELKCQSWNDSGIWHFEE